MEFVFVILNTLTKISMFVILLLPLYILSFYMLKFIFNFFNFNNIKSIKIISFSLATVIILTNVNFLDVY
ncbi:hypothetical protein D0412_06250 [Staphylococcus epidermidis]|nr:hypothetical protein [Staphylococcus epidermidis]MBM0807358.1 hypothetical protein [Staphylococcus epidermidis]MBM0832571.1 hypothetical protein [Staphylococcus epidermidis]